MVYNIGELYWKSSILVQNRCILYHKGKRIILSFLKIVQRDIQNISAKGISHVKTMNWEATILYVLHI